jgi:predicted component of type VI protein secretion system
MTAPKHLKAAFDEMVRVGFQNAPPSQKAVMWDVFMAGAMVTLAKVMTAKDETVLVEMSQELRAFQDDLQEKLKQKANEN